MTREEAINKYILPAVKRTWNEKICGEIEEVLKQEPCEDAKAHSKKEKGRPVVLPYRERKCRKCKYGDAYELQKPCIVYSESCGLFAEKE